MAADLLTVLASNRAGEKRFVPQDVGNDETKIMPSADIQAAIAANQDGKTQVVATLKASNQHSSARLETTESQTDADEEPLPTRSGPNDIRCGVGSSFGAVLFCISRGRDRRFGIKSAQMTTVPKVTGLSQRAVN